MTHDADIGTYECLGARWRAPRPGRPGRGPALRDEGNGIWLTDRRASWVSGRVHAPDFGRRAGILRVPLGEHADYKFGLLSNVVTCLPTVGAVP